MTDSSERVDEALGLVCNLPSEGRTGRTIAVQVLLRLAVERRESERGVVLVFAVSEDSSKAVLEFVLAERQCCERLSYGIRFEPGTETFSLAIEAPTGNLVAPLKALYAETGQE